MSWGDPTAFGLLLLLGGLTGFTSGLLGVGGGTIVVPALLFGLPLLGVTGPDMPKVAMGTSLALVVPTTFASAQAHAAKRSIDWRLWGLLAPGIVAGAVFTALFAAKLNNELLILLFIVLVLWTAWKLIAPSPQTGPQKATEPHLISLTVKGMLGGALSSLLGLGVGWFTVPIMARFTALPKAIGTATALALPMAIAGTMAYLLTQTPAGCSQCAGYIALPAVAAIGISAVLTAPFGAWAAHIMPVAVLKRIFAVFLIIVAGDLAYKTFIPANMMGLVKETLALSKTHMRSGTTYPQAAQAPSWLLEHKKVEVAQ
jgi:uncharacterized protein